MCLRELNVPGVHREKWNKRTISKLALRLVKLYNFDEKLLPNINKSRKKGYINHMLKERYVEGKISK